MLTEKEWLRQQEQINDRLRRRAEKRAHPRSDERPRRVTVRTLAPARLLQRTLASAARLLPTGG